jgi:hypothetical protein
MPINLLRNARLKISLLRPYCCGSVGVSVLCVFLSSACPKTPIFLGKVVKKPKRKKQKQIKNDKISSLGVFYGKKAYGRTFLALLGQTYPVKSGFLPDPEEKVRLIA